MTLGFYSQPAPGKVVGHLHTCGNSTMDTQDEDQENKKADRKALHGAASWALHSFLPNSS